MARGLRAKANALANQDRKIRDLRWWKKPKDEIAQAIWDNFRRIGNRSRAAWGRDLYYACLYDDANYAAAVQGLGAIGEFTPQTMATNICRRQVDTFTAAIVKNRPVPMALTTGGNYSEQRRAKAIGTFFEGVLDQVDYWGTRELRVRDGGIVGSGLALNYRVKRKMFHDRLFKREFRVCPIDAERGKPRTMYVGRLVDKLVLAERFPEHAEKIYAADADCGDGTWQTSLSEETDHLALVIEVWHLRSSPEADDGVHAISISNETLAIGEYQWDTFPVSKFDYSPAQAGYFGTGLIQQLEGLQFEINAVGLTLQERNYLMGTYVLREENAGLTFEHVDNGTMTELVWSGSKPEFLTPPPSHPQMFTWWETLRTKMPAEITGISGLATRSEKPAGLDSGKAIRTYHDIDTENLTPQGRADERDVIATCWQFFDLAEEIYSETGKEPEKPLKKGEKRPADSGPYMVRVEKKEHGRSVLAQVDFGKVRIDKEHFKLRTFPTNFLRGTPEEQMQSINEMIEAGFLSQDEALILLDFPDLQRVMNLRGAARHVIERILEKVLDQDSYEAAQKVYVYPEPAMNLELCKALAIMTYLEAKLDGANEGALKWVLQFAIDATSEMEKEAAKAAGPVPGEADAAELMGGPPVDPMADPALAGMPPEALYAPPDEAPMPAGAVAPEVMPALPGIPV